MSDITFELGAEAGDDVTFEVGPVAGDDVSFDIPVPGGGGGVTVHGDLTGRDAADQHPASAIDVDGTPLDQVLADLPTGGSGSGAQPVDLLVATTAADGTATTFDIIVWDQNATAAGNVPARYSSVFALPDVETFAFALAMAGFEDDDTVTVLVPGGSAQGVWQFTPATITDPWTAVDTSLVIQASAGYLGADLGDGWRKLNDADTIGYTGTGLLLGILKVHQALHGLEGILDRWQFVSGADMTGTVDVNATNPTLAYGRCEVGARVFIDGRTYLCVVGLGMTLIEHPDVFYPPGNGYRTTLVAPGDPATGMTWMWLDDDPTRYFRGGAQSQPVSEGDPGEWIVALDPTASGGGVALGETSTTAYRGDRGKTAYDHSQATGNPHGTTASDITSGTFDIARIPTGSTSSTVAIGNDSRLSDTRTPTDGSVTAAKLDATLAGRIPETVRTTGDVTRTVTTASDDSELKFTVAANTFYEVEGYIQFSGDATADARFQINGPSGTTLSVLAEYPAANIAASGGAQQFTHITSLASPVPVGVIASPGVAMRFKGWVSVGSTAGTVAVQWAQTNTGAGTGVTRHANSYLSHRTP